jgi:hypothetical protein
VHLPNRAAFGVFFIVNLVLQDASALLRDPGGADDVVILELPPDQPRRLLQLALMSGVDGILGRFVATDGFSPNPWSPEVC